MSGKMRKLITICAIVALIVTVIDTAQANWEETFDGNAFDQTWTFHCYPDLTGTFSATIKDGAGDNDYVSLDETTPATIGGSQFGAGFGSDEIFTDVRVGAVFNVVGDASRNYHGLAARTDWIYDSDGSHPRNPNPGYPGLIASCYVMLIHYEDGPTDIRIEVMKVVNNLPHIMETYQPEVPVPGIDNDKSRYVQLEVIGSDPVYITGSIYEYKDGPLLAITPTLIDTDANDHWERAGIHDGVFAAGVSGILGMWKDPQPTGYHTPFDSVSSIDYFVVDNMESYTTRADAYGVWRDGYTGTLTFSSGSNVTVSTEIDPRTTGPDVPPDNPPGPVQEGSQALQFSYDNDGNVTLYVPGYNPFTYSVPYYSEIEATTSGLGISSNWTLKGIKALTIYIYGNADNVDEQMYMVLEDSDSNSLVKCEKVIYGGSLLDLNLRLEDWQQWNIDLEEFSDVDLADVRKIYIGFGDRNNPQPGGSGVVYLDDMVLYQPRCIPALGPAGDIAEPFDCKVDFLDFAVMASGWLDKGLYP
jgi:hypothetical protein